MDCARTLIARGRRVKPVSEALGVSRAQLSLYRYRQADWQDGRMQRHQDDAELLEHLPTAPIEWLTDNGSAYRADETRSFAKMLGLEPRTTAIRSPQSNGVAESFVKTMKRDYIGMMPKPDSQTAVLNLSLAFEHYNTRTAL